MGSYSLSEHSLPYLTEKDKEYALNILKETVFALEKQTGIKYQGILYGQFMKTDDNIYLIEFNVRFGDPEALNVLKLLKTDFNNLSLQITDGNLKLADFENQATVCTYLVPSGYPKSPASSEEIQIEESDEIDLYYASVYRLKNMIRTTSSRSIALVGTGKDLEDAREKIANNISKIKGNLFYRKDIGSLL